MTNKIIIDTNFDEIVGVTRFFDPKKDSQKTKEK